MARPRKFGERWPSGKLKTSNIEQMAEVERKNREAEMSVVLAQPHRQGERSQWAESAFGRFCLANHLSQELYSAGLEYASVRNKFASAWGAQSRVRMGGSGGDVPMETLARWRDTASEWDEVLLGAGGVVGRETVVRMVVDELDPLPAALPHYAVDALVALAVHTGRLTKR